MWFKEEKTEKVIRLKSVLLVIISFHCSTTGKRSLLALRVSDVFGTFKMLKLGKTNSWSFLLWISTKQIQRM